MHQVNYALLNSHPEVEQYRDALPEVITAYKATVDENEKAALGSVIVLCAENFYGIDTAPVLMDDLIGMIQAADQELEYGN